MRKGILRQIQIKMSYKTGVYVRTYMSVFSVLSGYTESILAFRRGVRFVAKKKAEDDNIISDYIRKKNK